MKLNRGNEPIVNNNSGLIFHVFNSDYVNEQIVPNNYTPDGEIDGYIIGKEQVDLSAEKTKKKYWLSHKGKLVKESIGI